MEIDFIPIVDGKEDMKYFENVSYCLKNFVFEFIYQILSYFYRHYLSLYNFR